MNVIGCKRSVGEKREFQHWSLPRETKRTFAALRQDFKCAEAFRFISANLGGTARLSRPKAIWGDFLFAGISHKRLL